MFSLPLIRRRVLAALAIACALMVGGCAGLRCPRCPRIDPSGERCLIWPKDEAATVATVAPPATVFPAATATLPAIPGNPTAPPVTTDPVFPQPELPAVAAAAPGVPIAPVSTQVATPQDRLTLSPERILAPVGTEVVLKANICTTEGYTLAEQKVEWMLARDGVGEFVEVSGKGAFHPSIFPWNAGKKTDNYLATTYTANGPHCINRGTPDLSDDVNILRGDAWVTVTAPREGTSHVTAYTPTVEAWNLRKQVATIYWVDVQWTFPPAAVTSGGRETLTTQVNRQSDGTPLAGWIVRYEVSDGSGAGGAGRVSEVVTDAAGRASVQVSPTAAGAASSKIDMQLVRPANFGGSDSPRLVIGNGSTIINWSGGSTYVPSTSAPLTPVTPAVPAIPTVPMTPPTTNPPTAAPASPPPAAAAGPAKLELTVQSPSTAVVGSTIQAVATIRNTGQSPATNVILTDEFDLGLLFPAKPASNKIENAGIGSIPPGESRTIPINLQVTKAGSLCQTVAVRWDGGSPQSQRICVSATDPAPQRNAAFRIAIDAPLAGEQNQTAPIDVVVTNTGEVPLVNVRLIEKYPPSITPQPTDQGAEVISGQVQRLIERLEVGAKKVFRVNCVLRQSTRATIFVDGSAETDPPGARIPTSAEREIEITPPRGGAPTTGGIAPPASIQPLAVGVQIGATPVREGETPTVRVGTRTTCAVMVRNTTANPQANMAIRIYFPPEIVPDLTALEGPPGTTAKLAGGAVEFTAVPTIAAGEALQYKIPVNANVAGNVTINVQAVSSAAQGQAGIVNKAQNVQVLGNRL